MSTILTRRYKPFLQLSLTRDELIAASTQFGAHPPWHVLISKLQPGDQVWTYAETMNGKLIGESGYVIMRGDHIVHRMVVTQVEQRYC